MSYYSHPCWSLNNPDCEEGEERRIDWNHRQKCFDSVGIFFPKNFLHGPFNDDRSKFGCEENNIGSGHSDGALIAPSQNKDLSLLSFVLLNADATPSI